MPIEISVSRGYGADDYAEPLTETRAAAATTVSRSRQCGSGQPAGKPATRAPCTGLT